MLADDQAASPTNLHPLRGVKVLDLGMNIAGPQGASVLADLGATVVKVESPSGDTSRTLQPQLDGLSAVATAVNRGKRYVALDLRRPEVAPARDALLRWADVAVQNLRPGKAADLGIDADQCHAVNPRLVHVSIEAFYPGEGTRPGYDLLVQAESGMLHLTGDADGGPSRLPGSLLDHTTGLYAALGVTAALHGPRDRHRFIVTMSDVAQSLLADRVAAQVFSGEEPSRMGSATSVTTPLQSYATGRGDLVVGAANDGLFRRLSDVLDVPLADDERFATQAARLAHRAELDDAIEAALAAADADTWYDRLVAAGVPTARVRTLSDAAQRHRDQSRTGVVPVDGLPGAEVVASPLGGSLPLPRPGAIGADSRAVLVDALGLSADEFAALVESGAIVDGTTR